MLPISRSPRPIPLRLSVDNNPIRVVDSFKYLGVTISSDLSWSNHIRGITKAAKRQFGTLHRLFHQASPQARNKLYRSAILPKLEYCSSVWDPHQSTLISGLESVQKFAGRVVTQDWKLDYSSLCLSLGWQNLRARRKKQKLKVCYMILNNLSVLPSFHFTPNTRPSPRHPHSKTLFLPYARTNSHKFSFFIDVIHFWNSLPASVVDSQSPYSFKRKLVDLVLF